MRLVSVLFTDFGSLVDRTSNSLHHSPTCCDYLSVHVTPCWETKFNCSVMLKLSLHLLKLFSPRFLFIGYCHPHQHVQSHQPIPTYKPPLFPSVDCRHVYVQRLLSEFRWVTARFDSTAFPPDVDTFLIFGSLPDRCMPGCLFIVSVCAWFWMTISGNLLVYLSLSYTSLSNHSSTHKRQSVSDSLINNFWKLSHVF